MPGDEDCAGGSRIARFYREHDVRFTLCDDDGTEVAEIPRECPRMVADLCAQYRYGFVKQTWTPKTAATLACTDAPPGCQIEGAVIRE